MTMESKNKENRRQFLKNTALSALAISVLPNLVKGEEDDVKPFDQLACNPTTLDLYGQGPFYTANAPDLVNNQLAEVSEEGERLVLSGRVLNLGCTEFIENTKLDIWHANHAGEYDNSGYNLRGVTYTNSQGFYVFETILPGKYLNGSTFRPSHIHIKITPPGFPELTTQIYFAGDTDIPGDAAASVTSGDFDATHRIVYLYENSASQLEGNWDIVITGEGTTVGVPDLHIDKGVIYNISPNPFHRKLNIRYGVFKRAKVSLLAFDTQGRLVATLDERTLDAEQYDAEWVPSDYLQNGHYFIVLKINDLQVSYKKVLLQR